MFTPFAPARAAALQLGVLPDELAAFEALLPEELEQMHWAGAVRAQGEVKVMEVAVLLDRTLVIVASGYGAPWQLVLAVPRITELRHYPSEADGRQILRLRADGLHQELEARPDDAWSGGHAKLTQALIAAMSWPH